MALTRPTLNQINTTITALDDPITVVNKSATSANQDIGFVFNRDGGSTANVAVIWDETNDQFALVTTSSSGATNANVTISDYANVRVGGLTVDTNTLHVDPTNNRVGIGTTSPAYQVEIENTGSNALLVLDRTDGAACFIEGQATRSAFGSVGATPLALAYNSYAVVLIGANGAITVNPDGDGFTFPTTDGSAGQVLTTDGEGNVSFSSVATFSDLTITGNVTGNVIPSANLVYNLGSINNQWHSLYVGPGSLYINGQKVLQEDSGTIVVSAEQDQNISISTSGTGDIEFNPGGTIELKGNVVLAAGKTMSQAGGAASEFSAGVKADTITSRTADTNLTLSAAGTGVVNVNDNLTVAQNLTVTGNLTINGATTTVSSTNTTIEDALLLLADGQSGAPTKDAGFVVERGSSVNVAWLWDESADQFVAITTSEDGTTAGDVTVTDYTDIRVGAATIDDTLTLGGTLITATATEINYLDGVTSAIQTQIDNISSSFTLAADSGSNDTFTTGETLTIAGGTGIDTTVSDNQISIAVDSTIAVNVAIQGWTTEQITQANVGVVGYTDNAVTTANIGQIGYTDNAVTTANIGQTGYTDNAVSTANIGQIGYTDNAVTTANVGQIGYTDNAVTTANVGLKGYSDATFAPLGGATFTGTIDLSARNRLRFSDTDNSNYVEFRAPSIIAANITFTMPTQDGTSGQVLQTDGAGTLSFATASGGGGASGFQSSTITTHPAAAGNESLGTGPNDNTEETPFESGAQDAFGVSLGVVYDQMEPIGSTTTLDLGDEEAYVGA